MTRQEKIEAYTMRLDGITVQQIADRFGISKQYISQITPSFGRKREHTPIVYPNIEKHLFDNQITKKDFASICGVAITNMQLILKGKHSPSKKTIDAILKETGMTYEVAFAKRKEDCQGVLK